MDFETGAPVPNARITTAVVVVGSPVVLSGDDGRFALLLPSGPHDIVVTKAGYARYAAVSAAGGEPIEVRLQRGAAIAGRVADESGQPAVGFHVRIELKGPDGKRTVVADRSADDRGEYRFGGLVAGPYYVSFVPSVSTSASTVVGVVQRTVMGDGGLTEPFFYPGAATIDDAEAVVVRTSEERSGIDFVLSSIESMSDQVDRWREQLLKDAQQSGEANAPVVRTASVRGRVLDRDGHPLARARVLINTAYASSTASTDAAGRYELRGLPAGTFRVAALKPGYVPNASWAAADPAPTVQLKDGETREDVEIRLDRWAAIEGRVVDEHGDPMADALVQLLHISYDAGRRSLVRRDIKDPKTDDRGRFRMYNVPSGQYVVSAVVNDVSTAELPGYARGYYPGTPDASAAQYIRVPFGGEIAGVEIALARARTFRVSGKLVDASGGRTTGAGLLLYPTGAAYGEPVGARIQPDGAFEFVNVTPGRYVIQAFFPKPDPETEGGFAAVPVSVGEEDVTGLIVQAAPASNIAGRITFDAVDPGHLPRRDDIEIHAEPLDPLMAPLNNLARSKINGDWTLELNGITGTRRLLATRLPAGWALEAVRVDGVDITDRPLTFGGPNRSLLDVEIVLTDRVATLSTTVTDDRLRAVPSASVIVYSTESQNWYPASRFLRTATTDASGKVTVKGLPSGTYNVAAVARIPVDGDDAWQAPEYLESLSARATKVPITEGASSAVQVRVLAR